MVKRVTDSILHDQALNSVNKARSKQLSNQEKAITMKEVNYPSDDPIASTHILKIRNEERNTRQYVENGAAAESMLNTADRALEAATEVLVRARELAINQASDASATPETRLAIAKEVKELKGQLVQIANSKFGERYLFGGFQTMETPFDSMGKYYGDEGTIPVEIKENYYIGANIPGSIPFLGRTMQPGKQTNIFVYLDRLKAAMESNNTKLIQPLLDGFDDATQQIFLARAAIGAKTKAIEMTKETLDIKSVDLAKLRSELEDADVMKAFSEMNKDEDVLKRTMATGSKLIKDSLFDYLG